MTHEKFHQSLLKYLEDNSSTVCQDSEILSSNLAQLLAWGIGQLSNEDFFCQIGMTNIDTTLSVLKSFPEQIALIIIDPYDQAHDQARDPSPPQEKLAKTVQEKISNLGLEERVFVCTEEVASVLESVQQLFSQSSIGCFYYSLLVDYRTQSLHFALLKTYLADPSICFIDHTIWGSVRQANLDLLVLHTGFHFQHSFPHLSQMLELWIWEQESGELTDHDLTHLHQSAQGSLLSASPSHLTFAQPNPPSPIPYEYFPCRFIRYDNFLSIELNQLILNHAIQQQDLFIESKSYSTTYKESDQLRRSSRLGAAHFQGIASQMREKIAAVASEIFEKLKIENFDIQIFEVEMVASYNGCFFAVHADNSHPKTSYRQVSCVYYFHRDPKPFLGGNLRIYDTQRQQQSAPVIYGAFDEIEPTNNSMVFFASSCLHEILPVFSPSGDFTDSRFTINTWLGCKSFMSAV
ncbi:MAG: 2OG-Fe(II) oxygenase [Cyanobacteriota bacterium]|nr:2OG-Fe(II) oxygenase [Cyanobacteriota bacterium]